MSISTMVIHLYTNIWNIWDVFCCFALTAVEDSLLHLNLYPEYLLVCLIDCNLFVVT